MSSQEIIDLGWRNYLDQLKDDYSYVNVGITAKDGARTSIDANGNPTELTLVKIASVNEFGTDRIPSRPFIRQTFEENESELGKLMDKQEMMVLQGKITRKDALMIAGQTHSNQIKKNIATKGVFTPNAPETIARKNGKDTPLINTGRLRQSIDYEVG